MSKNRLPPPSQGPKSLHGPNVLAYTVGDWHPTPDATGPAAAVGLAMHVEWKKGEPPVDLVFRLNTPQAVDNLIQALLRHKRSVWPDSP